MKILITTEYFLKLVVEGQATGLRKLGHDVGILLRDHALEFGGGPNQKGDRDERDQILDRLRSEGVRIWEVTGKRRFGPGGLGSVLRAKRSISEWRPDVVSVHDTADPRLLFACFGRPMTWTLHDPQPHPGMRPLDRMEVVAYELWRTQVDRVVVHSKYLVGDVPRRWARKGVSVVPHGIDVAPCPMEVPTEQRILMFGRLEPYKGIEVLTSAMQLVWSENPAARLTIAGRGPEASKVPEDPRITLLDRYIREDEIDGLLASASVMVLPYTQASQSGVGLLSLSRGIPTIVTRTGGLPDLAVNEASIAEPDDPEDLADRILHALRQTTQDRARVIDFAQSKFDWKVVAQEYVRLYDELLGWQA